MSTSAELRRIVGAMTEPPWRVWTSNSHRRITAEGQQDGGVLSGHVDRRDGCPDLIGNNRDADLAAIATLANHADALVTLVEACECVAKLGTLLRTTAGTAASEFSVWERMTSALAAIHAIP